MPVTLQKKQEEEKELPKVAWTIKKIEAQLRLPEGADTNHYVAKYVMQSKDVAAKIKEINAVEELVRQKTNVRPRAVDYARAINTLCDTEKNAKSFVANPKEEFDKIAHVLERVLADWTQPYSIRSPTVLFKDLSDLKKVLMKNSGGSEKKLYGAPLLSVKRIEFDVAGLSTIERCIGEPDILIRPPIVASKDGRTFIVQRVEDGVYCLALWEGKKAYRSF